VVFVLGAPFVQEEHGGVGGDAERSRVTSCVRIVSQGAILNNKMKNFMRMKFHLDGFEFSFVV
jgi:hypothetical protein